MCLYDNMCSHFCFEVVGPFVMLIVTMFLADAADKIKTLMKGFNLPSNHIPDWASQIPEDKWISELLSKIAIQSQNNDMNL